MFGIVFPCYNDGANCVRFLETFLEEDLPKYVQVLVIEDGSTRAAEQVSAFVSHAQKFNKQNISIQYERLPKNIGKSGAILHGWRHLSKSADIEKLCFCDSDGAVHPRELARFLNLSAELSHDLIIGVRDQEKRKVSRTFCRKYLSKIYRWFVVHLLKIKTTDSQCGLKCVSKDFFDKVQPLLQSKRYGLDFELLFYAKHFSTQPHEIPVDWHEKDKGWWHTFSVGFQAIKDLIQFYINRHRKSIEEGVLHLPFAILSLLCIVSIICRVILIRG